MGVFLVYFGISMVYCPARHLELLGVPRVRGLGCGDGQRAQERALTPSDAGDRALAVRGIPQMTLVYHTISM